MTGFSYFLDNLLEIWDNFFSVVWEVRIMYIKCYEAKIMKKFIFTVMIVVLMGTPLFATDEIIELREYIIKELCKGIEVNYKNENGKTIIWHEASEKIVKIPKYKSSDSPLIESREMIPNDSGWVIKFYGPFDPIQTAKDWTVFFDNKKDYAEMLLRTDDKNLAIGVVIHYGKSTDKKIIEDLKKYRFKDS